MNYLLESIYSDNRIIMSGLNFTSFDHSFCEKQLWHIEYLNSFSSLFISAIGFWGFRFPHSSPSITLVYVALFLNGIGSFGYHWTNQIGWGLIDRMTMILISISSIQIGLETVFRNKFIFVLSQAYITSLLVVCALQYDDLFNILFGLFLVTLLLYVRTVQIKNLAEYEYIRKGYLGILFIVIAGLSWIITEKYCHELKYVPGHAIWHIAISYGGHLILQLSSNIAQEYELLP